MKTPCYGCQKRTLTCHGVCNDYREWKETNDAVRKNEADTKHVMPQKVLHYIWRKSRWH